MEHVPVLLEDVLEMARGMNRVPHSYLDVTFGRGGHMQALINEFSDLKVVALDQDPEAISYAAIHFKSLIDSKKLTIHHANFHHFAKLKSQLPQSSHGPFDFILADLGVSSPQLDSAERGFSFYADGPLDMRMNLTQELTAAHVVNQWDEVQLRDLFYHYGEVQRPGRVVNAILAGREERLFTTTLQLSGLIESTEGWRKKGQHPATRFFLALRMAVNAELEPLAQALEDLVGELSPGGRLVVLTFHSLEDRIVKQKFKAMSESRGQIVNKKVKQASWAEKKKNTRARSAKLRAFQKEG
jgi:16S rRNA (cytosine1402-N4)-methyltransferase